MYVLPDNDGAGISAMLMQASLDHAAAMAVRSMWLGVNQQNQRAQRFYAKHGFTIHGTKTFHLGSGVENDYVMVRPHRPSRSRPAGRCIRRSRTLRPAESVRRTSRTPSGVTGRRATRSTTPPDRCVLPTPKPPSRYNPTPGSTAGFPKSRFGPPAVARPARRTPGRCATPWPATVPPGRGNSCRSSRRRRWAAVSAGR